MINESFNLSYQINFDEARQSTVNILRACVLKLFTVKYSQTKTQFHT